MSSISLRLVRVLSCALALSVLATGTAVAQVPGDVNCDTAVTDDDLEALLPELFVEDSPACAGVDVNVDELVGAADITALILELRRVFLGPELTFLGVTSSDGQRVTPLGTLPDGTVVYYRNSGFGFQLVAEAGQAASGANVATNIFDYNRDDPTRRPDFLIQSNRDLGGEPSVEVCDQDFGVPGFDPPSFEMTQPISDAFNDLACRFSVTTVPNTACTLNDFGQNSFMAASTRAQFCLAIGRPVLFPPSDTVLTVQAHDEAGNPGRPGRLLVRVGTGPVPPTFTPIPPTPTRTATFTRTATSAASATPTNTPVPTRSFTRTSTRTSTPGGPTPTRTRTATRTPTLPPGVPTPTFTRTPTRTATRIVNTPTPTRRTSTPTRTRTATRPPATFTPTRSLTPTRTVPQTPTSTPTFGVARGPVIRFMGMTKADDTLIDPEPLINPEDPNEIRVYKRPFGSGFSLVIEARPGISGRPVGKSTFDGGGCPDFQIQVTRDLGENPTEAVCDVLPTDPPGGVLGTNPPRLDDSFDTCSRLNDLGCRFVDGLGMAVGRNCNGEQSCVRFESGEFGCVAPDATAQFCGFVARTFEFPAGDTLVSVRARDSQGNLGPIAQMIVRVD